MRKILFIFMLFIFSFSFLENTYAALPKSYSSVAKGYVTTPKDQDNYGTCVSFATISAIETNLIKTGQANKNINLSEYQLAYFIQTGLKNNATMTINNKNFLNAGTNYDEMQMMLSNNFKVTTENKINYKLAKTYKKLSQNVASSGNIYIKNSYELEFNLNNVKSAIMKYGSVTASYDNNKNYYNKKKTTYNSITNKNKSTRHAITIVGWDDNYSRNNFKYKPKKNGAWLVKNSWGTNWGNKGFFWISYESKNLSDNIYVYEAINNKKYYNRYEYDNTNIKHQFNYVFYQMNVFTAKNNEIISDVMFYTDEENCNYKIYYYDGNFINNKNINNTNIIKSGNLKHKGFHTVELSKKILIKQNQNFSIIIELTNKEGKPARIIIDRTSKKQILTTKSNRSYIKSYGDWEDLHFQNACCRIKVGTQRVVDFTFNKVAPIEANNNIKITTTSSNLINKKQFSYQILNSKNKILVNTGYINSYNYNWKPTTADTYIIKVYCKDLSTNKIYGRQRTFKVIYPKLNITFNKKTPQKRKTQIIIKANINLPKKVFRYKIYNSKGKVIKDSKITKNNKYNWKPTKKGTYKIKIYCKDLLTKKVCNKTYKYKIK